MNSADPWAEEEMTVEEGAVFSIDHRHRMRYWCYWGDGCRSYLTFVMLNPSKAGAPDGRGGIRRDPTVRKCIGFAKKLNYHGIRIVNLFTYIATKPAELQRNEEALNWYGIQDDAHLYATLGGTPCGAKQTIVLAWGNLGSTWLLTKAHPRIALLRKILTGTETYCFGRTAAGHPRHPLMLSYNTALEPYAL